MGEGVRAATRAATSSRCDCFIARVRSPNRNRFTEPWVELPTFPPGSATPTV